MGSYVLKETIGEGSFGKVKLGQHIKLGTKVAIKIINKVMLKEKDYDVKIQREIYNTKQLHHPHIVRLYEVLETEQNIFIVLEYVEGGELFDYIVTNGRLSEAEGRYFFQQLISAVAHCHEQKVSHRDLKPENLLLEKNTRNLKIADFGLSNIIRDGELFQTACGSPNYAAPEVLSGDQYSGPEVDIWSCGIILYALVTARLPFDDTYLPHLFNKIKSGKYHMPSYLSPECKDLIKRILLVNPVERLTVAEIRQHPWTKDNLPPYLEADYECVSLQDLNEQVVAELSIRLSISKKVVHQELKRAMSFNAHNDTLVAYNILFDSMNLAKEPKKLVTGHLKATAASFSGSPAISLRDEVSSFDPSTLSLRKTRVAVTSASTPNLLTSGISEEHLPEEKNKLWYLGLMSPGKPRMIMRDVMAALLKFKYEWKICGPYQLRCRNQNYDLLPSDERVKFGLQIFSVRKEREQRVCESKRKRGRG
eukprot:TRINITY_DN925_c0_g1_i1.p1 TRINITY_DN925_c0_g1~~TRINITY_DN925_c0_g1_i1.p1  ORF type:complete len:504 (-),score=73.28 TRINITY_DN925_c0_g1_i1:388-1824(-)